ncbi:MAG TPA: Hpt domain-containing protein, partial [Rhodocyclaceae bacterium]|nr:Hpt domain-containing protein [Rhodocyclaceae bacterium]
HYLDDLVAGQPDQPLRLLPAYRRLAAARSLAEPSPSELFFPDMSLRPPRREQEPAPVAADTLPRYLRAARTRFERGLLRWLRDRDPSGVAEMRQAVATIEQSQVQAGSRAFWWVTLGVLDAMVAGGLPDDLAVRRLCGRIDIQMKRLIEGARTVAERLMRDALYYVATAEHAVGDQVECVRAAYHLHGLIPKSATAADAEAVRPALRACHDLLAQAMDDWNRFCAGTAAALPQFHDRLSRLVTQAQALHQHELPHLVAALAAVADLLRKDPLRQDESIAIEVATALLLTEQALDAYEHLGPEFADQVKAIVARLSAMVKGQPLGALELPQLDEISRRAQERLVMNQVVKEIVVNLGAIEQTLDAFFRDTSKRADLAGLDKPLKQVQGALVVLGQTRATAVLSECEAEVARFASEGYEPQQADFEEVARKLSAIGFFVEQIKYGAADIDAILNPAQPAVPAEGEETPSQLIESSAFQSTARMTQSIIGALRERPEDEGVREEIKQSLETLREDAWLRADLAVEEKAMAAIAAIEASQPAAQIEAAVAEIVPAATPAAAPSPEAVRLADASTEEVDAELLGIFIEEAHEVLATIGELQPQFAAQPHDRETLTTIRRGFHTLKGSGRMVGLAELGEVAWAVEQVLNRWLRQELDATPALHRVIELAHRLFNGWVAQLEAGGGTAYDAAELMDICERLKSGEEAPLPAAVTAPPAQPAVEPAAAPVAEETAAAVDFAIETEPVPESVVIGDVVLTPTLYDMYLKESQGHIATLRRELGSTAAPDPVVIRAAHTLAGISGTASIAAVAALGHALESALNRFAKEALAP